VVIGVIDKTALNIGADDDGRNTGARAPTIGLRRRRVIPEATILVISHNDQHMLPLRALLQMADEIGDMCVTRLHIGIARMLVEIALRLVERDLWQGAGIDRLDELGTAETTIAQMLGAGRGARSISREVVIGLMMVLEVRYRRGVAIGQNRTPGAAIPDPGDTLFRHGVADRFRRLR